MAKKISSRDLFEQEDLFRGVRDSADQTITKLTQLKNGMIQSAKEMKTAFTGIKLDNLKDLEKFVQLSEKVNKITQQSIQVDKQKQIATDQKKQSEIQLLKIEQEKEKLKQQQMRTDKMVTQEKEKQNKQAEKQKKLALDQANAYKKLEKNTRELKNESKRLGAEMLALEQSGRKNSAEYRNLAQQYKQVTLAAQQGDTQLKKLDKTVGDNFRNVGNYKSALSGLNSALGTLGIAFGVGSIVRTGVGAIVEFDQAVADLSAITGASGEDLKFYREQANELGISVQGGASAVVEAYKLIGSAKPDLLENKEALNEVTKAAITLSQASGLELPDAATRLTEAMNQFKAPAEEATRYIDALANGAKFGSAEIPQITEALVKFGAVASSTGVSVEESTAAIELLAERGIKGAEAGTKLRNVMLKLSAPDALPKKAKEVIEGLGLSFEKLKDPSISFTEKLEYLKPLLQDNANLVQVFGLENEVAGQILLESTERLDDLNEKMHTQGTAQEQAATRTNTLGQALLELKNSFISLFTSMDAGEGSMQGFVDGIKWIASNLPTIIQWVYKFAKAWVVYRSALLGIKAVQWVVAGGFQDIAKQIARSIPLTRAYRLEQVKTARAMKTTGEASKTAATGVNGFGKALKGIAFIGAVTIIMEIAEAWYNVASSAAEARRQQDLYNQSTERGKKFAEETIQQQRDYVEEQMRLLDLDIRARIANGESEKKLAKERAQREVDIMKTAKDKIQNTIKNAQFEKKSFQDQIDNLERLRKVTSEIQLKGGSGLGLEFAPKTQEQKKALEELRQELNLLGVIFDDEKIGFSKDQKQVFDAIKIASEKLNLQLTEATTKEKELNENAQDFNNYLDEAYVKQKEQNYEIKKTTHNLNKSSKSAQTINTEFRKQNDYLSRQKELLFDIKELERERVIAFTEKAISKEYDKQLDNILKLNSFDATELNKLIKRKAELEKAAIRAKEKFEKEALQEKYDYEANQRELKLEEEYKQLKKNAKGNQEALDKIDANYQIQQDKLDAEEILRKEDLAKEKEKIEKQASLDITRINDDMYDDLESMDDKLLKALEDNNNKLQKIEEDAIADELERRRKAEEEKRQFIKLSTDYAIKQSQKVVDQIEAELEAQQKQADTLRELAKSGNIQAQESLAEQERLIAESTKRKEKELRRQQKIRLAQSVYETFSKNLESLQPGEKTTKALADTIRDTTLLQAFINSLPGFEKGTIDTGKDGQGVDGKGGMLSVLHPNERVVPKSLNDQLNGMSNEELTRIATEYQNGKLMNKNIGQESLNFAILVNELQDLKKVIQDKPETNVELGQITQSAMEIVQRTKKGNSVVYNRFKVK